MGGIIVTGTGQWCEMLSCIRSGKLPGKIEAEEDDPKRHRQSGGKVAAGWFIWEPRTDLAIELDSS
jgi:hypothetical protein